MRDHFRVFFLCQFEKPGMCAIIIDGLKIMLYSYSEEIIFFFNNCVVI